MVQYTTGNGRITKCMVQDALLIGKEISGKVSVLKKLKSLNIFSQGEFTEGVYQSKNQKQLKYEKIMKKKEELIFQSVLGFFPKFEQTFTASNKKTYKENMAPFFATPEVNLYVKEPYSKFDDRPPEKWYLIDSFGLFTVFL